MRNRPHWLLAALLLTGCDSLLLDPDDSLEPRDVRASYEWVEEGWTNDSSTPVGQPSVALTWALPTSWNGEVFRVYSRAAGQGGYVLAATVTSCGGSDCRYTDLNVVSGRDYEYFVAAVDEQSEQEVPSEAVLVRVPLYSAPAAPQGVSAVALDGGVWVRWTRATAGGIERYRVFLKQEGSSSVFVEVGETDGSSFLDTRATNGTRYGYQLSAVDTLGHTGPQSALAVATPRPDFQAEVIYPTADNLAASGFRFVTAPETEDPIVSGSSNSAQWRLVRSGSALLIEPLGATRVTAGEFTSALTCGPGSDSTCESIDTAAGAAFLSTPVAAEAGSTYLFRVTGSDGQTHYGKVRVQGRTTNQAGQSVLVFDWAYQLVANEPSLSRGAR